MRLVELEMLRENFAFVSFTEITGSAPYDASNQQLLAARKCRDDKHKEIVPVPCMTAQKTWS